MKHKLAPLIIFTYKRADTLRILVESLLKNNLASETILYIFSDGAKYESDITLINEVRAYIKQIIGFKDVNYYFSETNQGLANSIIGGVSEVMQINNRVIVLEDDLMVTPNFLVFMNLALDEYESNNKVFSISGYSFDLKSPAGYVEDAYFLNRGWSWGWATWKNRWDDVDWQVKDYSEFARDVGLQKEFNKGGSDLTGLLKKQMANKLDSWAIRWFFYQFRINGLTLYPKNSKVLNIGFDDRATHTTGSNMRYIPKMDKSLSESFLFPQQVEANTFFQTAFQKKMGILSRIKSKMASILINLTRNY